MNLKELDDKELVRLLMINDSEHKTNNSTEAEYWIVSLKLTEELT
jgi:hypothetical protein